MESLKDLCTNLICNQSDEIYPLWIMLPNAIVRGQALSLAQLTQLLPLLAKESPGDFANLMRQQSIYISDLNTKRDAIHQVHEMILVKVSINSNTGVEIHMPLAFVNLDQVLVWGFDVISNEPVEEKSQE